MSKVTDFIQPITKLHNTLRHLRPVQIYFFIIRRFFRARAVKLTSSAVYQADRKLLPLIPVSTFRKNENEFCSLNQTVVFDKNCIDWHPSSQSRLWHYHLNYFDQLRDPRRSKENKQFLIDDWIINNPQNTKPAWEPYTVSLRIVNWTAYMLGDDSPRPLPQHWLNSLFEQTLWLERNDERHILANHYFENIKALLFAGAFFQGDDAKRWLNMGRLLFLEQLDEQFLNDGGHYERSPHYHALMVENLLDLLNLCVSNPDILNTDATETLKDATVKGLAFLHHITLPDNSIPLLNDSVQNSAPSINELYEYAGKLIDISIPAYSGKIELIKEPDSGIYGYRHNNNMLVIDCGDIGPSYQPGHTHCDFHSFELMLDGQSLIVDSGVYEYQAGEMRNYVRSTAAHNTISVDSQEQTEIWGEFRVARRARKLHADIVRESEKRIKFSGSYTGFPQVAASIIHQRNIVCDLGDDRDIYFVQDNIRGKGAHRVDSFLHFHPDIEISTEGHGIWILRRNNQIVARIVIDNNTDNMISAHIDSGWYCPEFGLRFKNPVLVMSVDTILPTSLNYRIERET